MFSYPFHIRDYIAKTRHLTLFEDLAYRRLLDAYYTEEQPLPSDVQACARLVAMREHATEVEAVLREFFVLTEAGWTNDRCDFELAKYRALQESGRRASALRWKGADQEPIRNPSGTHQEPNANPMPTREPKNPRTQEPKKPKTSSPPAAFDWEVQDWVGVDSLIPALTDAYPSLDIHIELRKAKAWVLANPAKAKAKKDWPRFLNNWMSRNGVPLTTAVPVVGATPASSNPFEGLA